MPNSSIATVGNCACCALGWAASSAISGAGLWARQTWPLSYASQIRSQPQRAKALPGNPYDGHFFVTDTATTEKLTGCEVERAYVDKGYRGHETANPRRVFISGQKRGVFGVIKRELRRRSAIEAVIGHMKNDG